MKEKVCESIDERSSISSPALPNISKICSVITAASFAVFTSVGCFQNQFEYHTYRTLGPITMTPEGTFGSVEVCDADRDELNDLRERMCKKDIARYLNKKGFECFSCEAAFPK